ncbi:hypothetical protein C8Q80DRAFT_1209182 [Daedaleopsis nitida]|nr:hypothetical protein C8Q80DRAFT_1209182 [Daedaleopsis nitida]
MPRYTSRTSRARHILASYTKFMRKRQARHRLKARRLLVQTSSSSSENSTLSSDSESLSDKSSDSTSNPSSDHGTHTTTSSSSSGMSTDTQSDDILAGLPDLLPAGLEYLFEPGDLDAFDNSFGLGGIGAMGGSGSDLGLEGEGPLDSDGSVSDGWSSGEDADDEEEQDTDSGSSDDEEIHHQKCTRLLYIWDGLQCLRC